MVANSRDLLLHIGRDGIINYANKSSKRILQWKPEELIGRHISEIAPLFETVLDFPNKSNAPLSTQNDDEQIIEFLNKKGSRKLLKIRCGNFVDNPDINGLVVRAQDMSAQQKTELENKFKQDLFTAAFRINTAMCSITDPVSGEILDVNDAWVNTLGFTREEAIGKTSLELNIWGIPENRKKALNILQITGRLQNFEGLIRKKDGSTRTVLASAETVKIGSVERLLFSTLDISEQKRMEEEQKYRQDLFTASFRVNNALCSITDPESGEILDINNAWLKALGYKRSEVIGKYVLDLNIWKNAAYRNSAISQLRNHGRLCNHEEEIRTKNGNMLTVIYSAEILKIGSIEHLFSSARDITDERRQAAQLEESQERLRQAQKMEAVGQLTGGISHDFNNLLSIIIGNAEIIEESGGFNKQIDAILRASIRGSELTQSLLAFSRKQLLNPISFRLDTQLQQMLSLLPRTLGATICITTKTDPDLWECYADPGQVENVLLNLATNARDAMPDGGNLDIQYANKTIDEGDFVALTVADTGCGMKEETLKHILEPFFTTKKIGQGTGLGLSMVSGFTEQSNGRLSITSNVGVGTQVELCLPRSK
ncbi:MAG: PAS domain S-box protein [Sneathiella sp.]|nr:PAS domain S-box protein [Sneathiella sp.]